MNPLNLQESLIEPEMNGNVMPSVSSYGSLDTVLPTTSSSSVNSKTRISIVTSGSRGDVQPYISLALHLQSRGYDVNFATESRMQSLVEEFKLPYSRIAGDPCGVLYKPEMLSALKNGSIYHFIRITNEYNAKVNKREIYDSYKEALQGSQVIIAGSLSLTPSYCIAEYCHAVWLPMILGPTIVTSEFPLWAMEKIIFCSCLNKWSYNVAFDSLWQNEKKDINLWRHQSLQLPDIANKAGISGIIDAMKPPILVTCSPLICLNKRIPFDYPANAHMLGFVFVPPSSDASIPTAVHEFLAFPHDTRPIVYFGFGSMPAPNPLELMQLVIKCIDMLNVRGVLVAGWSELSSLTNVNEPHPLLSDCIASKQLLVLKAIPHDWLFPKMSAIVHHCGLGTTAAALRSGVPQVACPFMLDQFYNAKAAIRLGVSHAILPYDKHITCAKLVHEIHEVLHEDKYKANAQTIGALIREESATCLDRYCDIIVSYINANSKTSTS